MTMQVGMRLSSSIVLAGDKRWTFDPLLATGMGWPGGRYGGNASKIKISSDGRLAIACSDNMEFSGRVAERLLASVTGDPVSESIKEVADSVVFRERKSQLLIASVRGKPTLHKFASWREDCEWVSACQQWDDVAVGGDRTNAAIFFVERYQKEVVTQSQAIHLAAHLITCSEILNTAGIQGLEVAVCDSSGIRQLPEEEIKLLRMRSLEHDKKISEMILGKHDHD